MKIKKFDEKYGNKINKVEKNFEEINEKIKKATLKLDVNFKDVNFMAVTKNVDVEIVNVAIRKGIKLLGENRVEELEKKYHLYEKEKVKIHFIGHLQSRKVKKIISLVDCIESVDSIKLAEIISKHAEYEKIVMPIFLEINIGNEETKFGFKANEILNAIANISKIPNIKIQGLMTIPPKKNVESYFKQMQSIYIDILNKKIDNVNMQFLSMGMSSDFEKAIKFGVKLYINRLFL